MLNSEALLNAQMPIQDPVVVVTGITGSEMRDEYDVDPRAVDAVLLLRRNDWHDSRMSLASQHANGTRA